MSNNNPRVDKGGWSGRIEVDSNRNSHYQGVSWVEKVLGLRSGVRECILDALLWSYGGWLYSTIVSLLVPHGIVISAVWILMTMGWLLLAFISYYRTPRDLGVLLYRIVLISLGAYLYLGAAAL